MRIISEFSKQLWNIGFCECTPEWFIKNKGLPQIKWMKHTFRDRWFADPFIYRVSSQTIVVFVEEYQYTTRKGVLCELEIDRESMKLCERRELLSLNTHLSYPIWLRVGDKVFLYPENGESGHLLMYEYSELNHKLFSPKLVLDDAVADSSIVKVGEEYYLAATKYPKTMNDLYLYHSSSYDGPYTLAFSNPVQTDCSMSRPGGNWFRVGNHLYRPAQNCKDGYGRNLSIMETRLGDSYFYESALFTVAPDSFRYNSGLHTINFHDGMCVIDAHGYKYPAIGRFLDSIRKMRRK